MPSTPRSEQSKPVARGVRKATCNVYYLGRASEAGTHSIALSIRGQRYEYFLLPQQCETVEQLCRKGLGRRALNYAKARAYSVLKVQPSRKMLATST